MIDRIEPMGPLVADTSLPGERKADDVFPAHPNGIQLSRGRWLIVFATRGYRFMDDDRSILWQIRDGAPDGPVVREGAFSLARDGWIPPGSTMPCFKQHGHPVAFGVPKGALVGGRVPPHANLFVAKWRVLGIPMDRLRYTESNPTVGVEWLQFRLNDREDDLEILEPSAQLRQKGLGEGPAFCAPKGAPCPAWMNQTFIPAVPFNAEATEWADVNHFEGWRCAALRYRYSAARHRYEWVETGALLGGPEQGYFECSLLRLADHDWVVALRCRKRRREAGSAWIRTADPFARLPTPVRSEVPRSDTPLPAFLCADGVIRLFANDHSLSAPPRGNRNPLRCWDVDPSGFVLSNPRVVFDTFDAGLPMSPACDPGVDMAKLLPHGGGRAQILIHRLRTGAVDMSVPEGPEPVVRPVLASAVEKQTVGIYAARIVYTAPAPAAWAFADPKPPEAP
jgi:hypothetical protein